MENSHNQLPPSFRSFWVIAIRSIKEEKVMDENPWIYILVIIFFIGAVIILGIHHGRPDSEPEAQEVICVCEYEKPKPKCKSIRKSVTYQ